MFTFFLKIYPLARRRAGGTGHEISLCLSPLLAGGILIWAAYTEMSSGLKKQAFSSARCSVTHLKCHTPARCGLAAVGGQLASLPMQLEVPPPRDSEVV